MILSNKNEIIYSEKSDRIFSVKKDDGKIESFFIMRNKTGYKWIEICADDEDYEALVSYIKHIPDVKIISDDEKRKELKYSRHDCEFSLQYIEYVDMFIDPYWDGEPFIKFCFVEKGHPKFEIYANEVLELCEITEAQKNKQGD